MWIAICFFFISAAKSNKQLHPSHPERSIWSLPIVASVVAQFIVHIAVLMGGIVRCNAKPAEQQVRCMTFLSLLTLRRPSPNLTLTLRQKKCTWTANSPQTSSTLWCVFDAITQLPMTTCRCVTLWPNILVICCVGDRVDYSDASVDFCSELRGLAAHAEFKRKQEAIWSSGRCVCGDLDLHIRHFPSTERCIGGRAGLEATIGVCSSSHLQCCHVNVVISIAIQ